MAKYYSGFGGTVKAFQWGTLMASLYTGYQAYYGKPIYGLNTNWKGQLKGGSIPPVRTLDQLSPTEIANMSLDDIKAAIPYNKGWTFENNNGHVHIRKNANSKPIIKIDPPDKVGTPYWHMHFLDGDGNPLDINGHVVPRRSPAAHIPWNQGPQ